MRLLTAFETTSEHQALNYIYVIAVYFNRKLIKFLLCLH